VWLVFPFFGPYNGSINIFFSYNGSITIFFFKIYIFFVSPQKTESQKRFGHFWENYLFNEEEIMASHTYVWKLQNTAVKLYQKAVFIVKRCVWMNQPRCHKSSWEMVTPETCTVDFTRLKKMFFGWLVHDTILDKCCYYRLSRQPYESIL